MGRRAIRLGITPEVIWLPGVKVWDLRVGEEKKVLMLL